MGFTSVALIVALISLNTFYVVTKWFEPLDLTKSKISEIGKMSFPEIAAMFGHPAETRDVITEDGYILTLYHIVGDKTRPVLLVHGNTASADSWISRGNISLAIAMARKGFDVWAINLRGTTHSRRHRHLDADLQPERFFDFSFYEQAVYDMPATVDLILRETAQHQLTVLAFSLGTTLLYVLGSEKPEYNDKITLGVSLSPIFITNHPKGVNHIIRPFEPLLLALFKALNVYEMFGYKQIGPLLQAVCLQPFGYDLCIRILFFGTFGYDEKGFEPEFMSTLLGHYPGGTSLKTAQHTSQVNQRNEFAKFDYGRKKNMVIYKRPVPPPFDMSKVTMKSALFLGKADLTGTIEDSKALNASLPNVVHYEVLPYEHFNHLDFIWGRHMPESLYPHIFKVIDKYVTTKSVGKTSLLGTH